MGTARDNEPSTPYAWYFASHAMFQSGREAWQRWLPNLTESVIDTQRQDDRFQGSWDPTPECAGRIAATALMVMALRAPFDGKRRSK